MLIAVRVTGIGRLAQTRRLTDERLIDMFPERAGMDEHLVIETRRQEARQMRVDRTDIEIEARPVVLADAGQPVEEFGRGDTLVGLEPGALTQTDKRIRLFRAGGHDAARAVVLERP